MNYLTKSWLGLLAIAVIKNLENKIFSTLEVDFVKSEMKENMAKCRICKYVQDMQTRVLHKITVKGFHL